MVYIIIFCLFVFAILWLYYNKKESMTHTPFFSRDLHEPKESYYYDINWLHL